LRKVLNVHHRILVHLYPMVKEFFCY
jgi:hypothetical protein